jgi:acyl-coenzyme A synthetase/AMP-(fatty) acid ligase
MMLCYPTGNDEALQMIRLFNASMLALATVQLKGFLAILKDQAPPPSLELVVVSGSRLPVNLLNEARARLCSNILMGYGSTEMGSMTGGNAVSLERYEGSAGYVRPWVELQAVDNQGRPVAAGSDGILRARSNEMAFYAAETADPTEVIRDGWFYPGDVGRVYADGLVVITGRTTEVINRGGVIVAPEFVEEVLRLDPVVRDVAVVGVSVAGIEEIWAAVVSDEALDVQSLAERAFVRLNEKTPNRILRVDVIPRNENGKVTRNALREILLARVRAN